MTASPSRVRPPSRWIEPPVVDVTDVQRLRDALHLPDVVCQLLAQRGHTDVEAAKRFLRPKLEHIGSPYDLLGMTIAVERLVQAIRKGEVILVHGDYDVDGMCSTALLTRALRRLGGTVVPFIPHRLTDGYDLTDAGVQAAITHKAGVVLTADCGTSALPAIAALCAAGIDVIVSDHHLPGGPLPQCVAILNPKQPGCPSPDKDFAAVGIAFKLALAVSRAMGESDNFVFGLLDFVALATVADLAPLRGENRVFVRFGLKVMTESRHAGLRALIRASGLEGKPLTAGRVGFILGPRLNAVGRLGNPMRGVELLLTDDSAEANEIARELEEMNQRRQSLDRATLDEAMRIVDTVNLDETYGLVIAKQGWHAGVIGIVASRIVEQVSRPVVMVALEGETGKGSGRSISAFDLHAGLSACRQHLERFGGHRAAAGLTVKASLVPTLQAAFNDIARRELCADDLVPEQRIDLEVREKDVTDELEKLLQYFEPHGLGNPTPTLALRGARIDAAPRRIGSTDGVRTAVATETGAISAIGWRLGERAKLLDPKTPVDVAFRLDRDEYRGANCLQLNLVDVRR
ncbi:MAG TPA: single-stranded-DNA-specific exonuclease RecJ [Gemmatimonadaceae bacterium]|nr:single-stranded-DNA-specific exonuclease RecJ [Gemmatimonadaceae bacterium]